MEDSGSFLGHIPCVKCDSSDGLSIYQKTDENGAEYEDGFCFSCESYVRPKDLGHDYEFVSTSNSEGSFDLDAVEDIKQLDVRGVKERRLKKRFCEMYDMRVSYDQESGEIDAHYYPVTKNGEITGYKIRDLPKQFRSVGDTKKCQLFGQHLFEGQGEYANKASKKFVILTEGELESIAIQQAMQEHGNKAFVNAVVSLPSGANTRAVKDNYEFLNSYETVIIALDQDSAGEKASKEIAQILPMGKAKIAMFSEKDACDMLVKKKDEELSRLIWTAKSFTPQGIISGEGLWEAVSKPLDESSIDYPWEGLNKITHGIRTSELVTIVSGSGMGKSEFARAIIYHILKTTEDNIGSMFLEESTKKTGLALMSFEAKKLLHLPHVERTQEEMKEAFNRTLGTGRVFLFDSFGSNDIDTICSNISYLAKVADCKYIILDHVSILVSGTSGGDERKALDEIATRLRTLVQELDISLFIISHLKRVEGESHEGGAKTSLSHIRGSAGIGQLSDLVWSLERNNQHEDPVERNTTTVRVLKNRFSGETGEAARVHFNNVTGELTEVFEDDTQDLIESSEEEFLEGKAPWDY